MGKDMKPKRHHSSTIILKPLNALLCHGSLTFLRVLRYTRKLSSPLGTELHSKREETNMPGDKSKMEGASEGKCRLTQWCCWDPGLCVTTVLQKTVGESSLTSQMNHTESHGGRSKWRRCDRFCYRPRCGDTTSKSLKWVQIHKKVNDDASWILYFFNQFHCHHKRLTKKDHFVTVLSQYQ